VLDNTDTSILIAGEDRSTQNQLADQLQKASNLAPVSTFAPVNYHVSQASDTGEVLTMLEASPFNLLFLDSGLSGGESLLKSIRASSNLAHLPVVVISHAGENSYSGESDIVLALLQAGADDFIPESTLLDKQAGPALLNLRIRSLLEKAQFRNSRTEMGEKQKLIDDLLYTILPLGQALSAEKDMNRLLERILLETMSLCNADAGTLYLPTEDNTLRFAMMHTQSLGIALGGTTGKEIPFHPLPLYDADTGEPNYRNVATYVALKGQSINVADIYKDDFFDFTGTKAFDAQNNYFTNSNLTIPLKDHENNVIGVLQLINSRDSETGQTIPFSSYLQQVAESLASQAAVALHNKTLLDEQQKMVKIQRDMEIARQIQADFLPESLPQSPGWEFEACFYPARTVAGDFYDVFSLPSQHPCIVIADVCDKGVGAALYMALIRSLIRAFSQEGYSDSKGMYMQGGDAKQPTAQLLTTLLDNLDVLSSVVQTNNFLISNHSKLNMFATVFIGVIDPETNILTYINAGHNPPIVFNNKDGIKERLKPSGPAVGIFPATNFLICQTRLEPGDFLFTFTDGVSDARSPVGTQFSDQRIRSVLTSAPVFSARQVLDQLEIPLWAHIADAEQYDDITMLVVYHKPEEAEA
jgi:sigma-B regulation protein RsbU (phosphoserine phosphatase)